MMVPFNSFDNTTTGTTSYCVCRVENYVIVNGSCTTMNRAGACATCADQCGVNGGIPGYGCYSGLNGNSGFAYSITPGSCGGDPTSTTTTTVTTSTPTTTVTTPTPPPEPTPPPPRVLVLIPVFVNGKPASPPYIIEELPYKVGGGFTIISVNPNIWSMDDINGTPIIYKASDIDNPDSPLTEDEELAIEKSWISLEENLNPDPDKNLIDIGFAIGQTIRTSLGAKAIENAKDRLIIKYKGSLVNPNPISGETVIGTITGGSTVTPGPTTRDDKKKAEVKETFDEKQKRFDREMKDSRKPLFEME